MNPVKRFRHMLTNKEVIVAPGVYNCVAAKIAEKVGFPAIYMGGFITSASVYGEPDVGLVTGTEMISHARNITASVNVPVLADADTGYGNAINVRRTVQEYEKAGVAGIHIEDQAQPKKCGNLPGRHVISTDEMVAKIKAAVDARVNEDFVIVARSDAYAEYGMDGLIERGRAYVEAGADVLMLLQGLGPRSVDEMKKIGRAFNVPLLFNMRHYGAIPYMSVPQAVEMGYRLIINAWGSLGAAAYATLEFMKELKEKGTIEGFANRMIPFDDFTDLLGLPEINALESKYRS
ncbi:MAG: isocitrate lyase/PEP mutase family protein [Betaproteobacteria bacterium]|nr:isocitrate lyase/PEP mutase family protein [Betaproteobacteria bacterium]